MLDSRWMLLLLLPLLPLASSLPAEGWETYALNPGLLTAPLHLGKVSLFQLVLKHH